MATFKVGDRARVVRAQFYSEAIGRECTVVCVRPDHRLRPGADYGVEIDGFPNTGPDNLYGTWWSAKAFQLAPLVDDNAWAKRKVKQLTKGKPYLEPAVAPKVRIVKYTEGT